MRIIPSKLISDLQSEFNTAFPFLKLEFYQQNSKDRSGYFGTRVGDYQRSVTDGSIDVYPEMKVGDLEKTMKDIFRLNVQVFRRSGKLWLQTSMTDHWTLQKQNEHGRELSYAQEPLFTNKDDSDAGECG